MIKNRDITKIRIDYLLTFRILVESENFSETAKILNKSQGTVSLHLKELEKVLGDVVLIHRTSQLFRLTKYGRIFYDTVCKVLDSLEKCCHQISEKDQENKYNIDISSSSIPGEYILPKLMMDFQQKYPKTHFSIQISNTQQAIQNLIDEKVRFCAVGGFLDFDVKMFEKQVLEEDGIVIFAREGHPIFKEKEPIEGLSNYPWIFRERGSATRETFLKVFPNSNKFRIVLEFQDNIAIFNAVRASDALSALSYNLVSSSHASGVKILKIPSVTPVKRKLYLLKLIESELKTFEKSFWDSCR